MSSALQASPEETKAVYSKVTRHLIPFLFLCFLFSFIDRVNVGFAKLQMSAEIGLTATAFGLGAGIFFVGYVVFEIPSNLWMTKVGAKKTLARIMIGWGVVSASTMFVWNDISFYVVRFLLGAFEAGFAPGLVLFLTFWYPAAQRAKIMAYILTGIAVAGIIGGPVSGAILTGMHQVAGLSGWQWMFLLEALPTILLGFLVFRVLADSPEEADWLNAREKSIIHDALEADRAAGNHHHSFAAALRDRNVWLLGFAYLSISAGAYLLTFWLPSIINELGEFTAWEVGLLTAIPFGVAAVMMVVVSLNSDRTKERKAHLIIAGLVGLTALVATTFVQSPYMSMALFAVAAAGILSTMPVFWSMPPQILTGLAAAGGIALINSLGNVGGFIAPYLTGAVVDQTGSTDIGLYVMSGLLLLGLCAIALLKLSGNKSAEAPTAVPTLTSETPAVKDSSPVH